MGVVNKRGKHLEAVFWSKRWKPQICSQISVALLSKTEISNISENIKNFVKKKGNVYINEIILSNIYLNVIINTMNCIWICSKNDLTSLLFAGHTRATWKSWVTWITRSKSEWLTVSHHFPDIIKNGSFLFKWGRIEIQY